MLKDKKEYVLHYQNLQLYMSLSLKIRKVHRVLEFDQSPWLKQYIDFNTDKRKHAKNYLKRTSSSLCLWEDHGKLAKESGH